MNRIDQKFKELKNSKALIPFITAGDPDLKTTEALVLALEKAGADIIELGIPFSDPMADGPVIQAASERALKKGTTLLKVLALVKKLRSKTQIPIVLMGYYNPIFVMGEEKFVRLAKDSGVDGVLVVDLPPEESASFNKLLNAQKIHPIFLLAPTSDDDRIKKVARLGRGYLYYVSMTGITGAQLTITSEIKNQIARIRTQSRLPIVVGFGITKPDQAKILSKEAEGIVIGSALVKLIHESKSSVRTQKVSRFISSLKKAIS